MGSFLSHRFPGAKLLGHMVHLCLISKTMQTVVSSFYIPINDVGESHFWTSLVTFALQYSFEIRKRKSPTYIFVFQVIALRMKAKQDLKIFHLNFPDIVKHIFMCLLVICVYFVWRNMFLDIYF